MLSGSFETDDVCDISSELVFGAAVLVVEQGTFFIPSCRLHGLVLARMYVPSLFHAAKIIISRLIFRFLS